jgi:hypothetical protein
VRELRVDGDVAGAAAMIRRRRRPRLTAFERRERFAATRAKWAATLPPELRSEFDRLLDEADVLVDRGWQLRVAALTLARQHKEGCQ